MKLTSGQFFIFRNDGAISKNKAKNASETNNALGLRTRTSDKIMFMYYYYVLINYVD